MPSPFPGMDPYLEDPARWPDLHHRLISEASNQLNAQLRPRYLARIEERVYVAEDEGFDRFGRRLTPDLRIEERAGWEGRPPGEGRVGVALTEPIIAETMAEPDARERRVEIVDLGDHAIVAVIEVVSPANKAFGSRGADSFAQKRWEVMHSPCHWVEIDLLRRGHSPTPRHRLPPHSYLAHVSRAEDRPRGALWPIRLDEPLPRVAIPLRAGDADAHLDLGRMLASAYDNGSHDLLIDYRPPPRPPLAPEWDAWADRLLRDRGLRAGPGPLA